MTFKVREKDLEGSIALYNKFIVILKIILIQLFLLEVRPDIFDERELEKSFEAGKVFIHKKDKNGVICVVFFPRNHHPYECPCDPTIKFEYWWLMNLLKIKKE